jgi:hypothetical protein
VNRSEKFGFAYDRPKDWEPMDWDPDMPVYVDEDEED